MLLRYWIIIIIIIIDLITLHSISLLGNLHMSQTVGGIRLSQGKQIHPNTKVKRRVLVICLLYTTRL
jgi:hypothetical protein